MGKTLISWTDQTDNPIYIRRPDGSHGGHWCRKVSPGCANCYAEAINNSGRFSYASQLPYAGQPPGLIFDETIVDAWASCRTPKRRFVCSMTDLFGEWVPQEWHFKVFDAAAKAPKQTIQLLTKRPEIAVVSMADWCKARDREKLPSNVWMGVSIEDEQTALKRFDAAICFTEFCEIPWISYEPALGYVDFQHYFAQGFRWIVLGGESGGNARPCEIGWLFAVIDDAEFTGLSVFVKQVGSNPVWGGEPLKLRDRSGKNIDEFPPGLQIRQFPA